MRVNAGESACICGSFNVDAAARRVVCHRHSRIPPMFTPQCGAATHANALTEAQSSWRQCSAAGRDAAMWISGFAYWVGLDQNKTKRSKQCGKNPAAYELYNALLPSAIGRFCRLWPLVWSIRVYLCSSWFQ
jgi:hypothetical protein